MVGRENQERCPLRPHGLCVRSTTVEYSWCHSGDDYSIYAYHYLDPGHNVPNYQIRFWLFVGTIGDDHILNLADALCFDPAVCTIRSDHWRYGLQCDVIGVNYEKNHL